MRVLQVWNTSARNAPPVISIQTVAPVLRSRFTTFGKGLVTIAQKGELAIRLWSIAYALPTRTQPQSSLEAQ